MLGVLQDKRLSCGTNLQVFVLFGQGPLADMDYALDNFPFLVWPNVLKVFSVASRHILDQKVSNERYRYPLSIGTL